MWEGTLGQQQFKLTFNSSAPTNVGNLSTPLNSTKLLELLNATFSNSFHFSVCDCILTGSNWDCSALGLYEYFIDFLIVSQQQPMSLKSIWLGLYPFTEAIGQFCLPPTDDPRTIANESLIFANANYTCYSCWAELAGQLALQFPLLVCFLWNNTRMQE